MKQLLLALAFSITTANAAQTFNVVTQWDNFKWDQDYWDSKTNTCNFSITPSMGSYQETANTGSVSVTAQSSCQLTATSPVSWITISTGQNGKGNGIVTYNVLANQTPTARQATLTIAEQSFSVSQAGIKCSYVIYPTAGIHSASVESGNITVTAPTGCTWNATTNETWLTLSNASGNGNGKVTYTVTANPSYDTRQTLITLPNNTFNVAQSGKAKPTYPNIVVEPAEGLDFDK